MPPDAFGNFPRLPAELRLMVWEHALSAPAVLATTLPAATDERSGAGVPRLAARFIGPAPYLAGLSCAEARAVMERSCVPFAGLQGGTPDPFLLFLERTVFYLGNCADVLEVLCRLRPDVFRIRHVAVQYTDDQVLDLLRACRGFTYFCPALETVIVERVPKRPAQQSIETARLGPRDTVYSSYLSSDAGPELRRSSHRGTTVINLWLHMRRVLKRPCPKLHLLGHANCAESDPVERQQEVPSAV